jgi:hypothetical protein
VNPNPPIDSSETPDDKRPIRKIDQAFVEVARLSGTDSPPAVFFQEFLEKTLNGIDAPAGAVWLKNVQGFLQLQCQVNIDGVGLDKHKNGRQSHNELLRQAFQTAKPILLEPFGSTGILEGIPAGNPTDFVVLLAPITLEEKSAVGLVEIWQEPRWDARVKRMHLNYLVQMAGYASTFVKNQQNRQSANQEQLWTQLESFATHIHGSLDPTTVSYHVANEGRRLVGCDRLSVAVREPKKAKIEAVSGADVVEKRSSQIQLMRQLADAVFKWNEKLVYRGVKDDGLPPDVYEALDRYLAQSPAKLLVFQPLHDQREFDKEKKELKENRSRSALLMECFEPPNQPEPLISRLDVVGRHAASALYNSVELRKIPFAFLWKPVLALQEGLGGKTKLIAYSIATAVALLILALIFVPWQLKMDAKGELAPEERIALYPPRAGFVERIVVDPENEFNRNQVLLELRDDQLEKEMWSAKSELNGAQLTLEGIKHRLATDNNLRPEERDKLWIEQIKATNDVEKAQKQLELLASTSHADPARPGRFQLISPEFDPKRARSEPPRWKILNGNDILTELRGRYVKPSDPIIKIGEVHGEWEIPIRIPQKHIGQVQKAFVLSNEQDLDVELKLDSKPTQTFRGKLAKNKVQPAAVPNRDDHNETEPVVYAYVRLSGDDIPKDLQVPREYYLTGVEVRANIRCGSHSMGYSLFYGLGEFVCQKIFQFF